jgi:hypothetical protein
VSNRKEKKSAELDENRPKLTDPWITMRSAIYVIAFVSLAMVILVVVQGNPAMPIWERILYGLGFGASIWVVAIVFYVFNRFILRR